MLTAERNRMLTQVGPGTPMGELLRRYWHPIGGASDPSLAKRDRSCRRPSFHCGFR
jgi:hypothetical protein